MSDNLERQLSMFRRVYRERYGRRVPRTLEERWDAKVLRSYISQLSKQIALRRRAAYDVLDRRFPYDVVRRVMEYRG